MIKGGHGPTKELSDKHLITVYMYYRALQVACPLLQHSNSRLTNENTVK